MTRIIGVAGPIGAGKSVIADSIAEACGGARRSFGSVVRKRANAQGLGTDRESLQELGDTIIATEGWSRFCREAIDDASSDTIVVDGIRHAGAIDALTDLAGSGGFALVFVDAPRPRRLTRVMARDGGTEGDFVAAEAHPNEREIPLVRARADVVVTNDGDGHDALADVIDAVLASLAEPPADS